jgi:hypothetical protein
MTRAQPIRARPGQRSGEFVVALPPGWELRLRRVLKELLGETLPDPRAPGLSAEQRRARVRLRQQRMREGICRFLSDLVTADIVGKEVALSTRSRYGERSGSLREQVAAILRDVSTAAK